MYEDENFLPYVQFKQHWEDEVKKAGSVEKAGRQGRLKECYENRPSKGIKKMNPIGETWNGANMKS